ncbi:MAG TPA: hypothetical protein VME46_23475 [Acidimicrobiales bacterium]|nr:hypothetical protein [Acidimicrobiales bacterium]
MSQIDLWYATRATGITALVLLTATVFLGILVAGRAPSSLPAFARADLHRRISALAVVFLAVHVLTSLLDSYVHIGWWSVVVPLVSGYHRAWLALGTVGLDLLLAVGISSVLRAHIPARAWRLLHWLAYLSWPSAVVHALGMGSDARFAWLQALIAVCAASVAGAALWRALVAGRARAARPETIIRARRSLRVGAAEGAGR